MLAIGLLTLMIVALSSREVVVEWNRYDRIHSITSASEISDRIFFAVEQLAIERDIAYALLYTKDADTFAILEPKLEASRSHAEVALRDVLDRIETSNLPGLDGSRKQLKTAMDRLQPLRDTLRLQVRKPLSERDTYLGDQWLDASTQVILQTEDLWMNFIGNYTNIDAAFTLHLRYKHYLGLIMDLTGRERALIGGLIAQNAPPTPRQQADLLRWKGSTEMAWERIRSMRVQGHVGIDIDPLLTEAEDHYQTIYDTVGEIFYMPGSRAAVTYPIDLENWLVLAGLATDSLNDLKESSLAETQDYVKLLSDSARRTILMHCSVLAISLSLCSFGIWLVNSRVIGPIEDMVEAMMATISGRQVEIPQLHQGSENEIGQLAQVLTRLQQTMRDIQQAQDALQKYADDLERSNRELDEFAYIASHDLKEPLRGLHNHARFLLEDNADKLDADSVNRLNRLAFLSQRMEKLVNDLLYFSRLGRQDLAIQRTDLNEVVRDVEATLETFLHERNAKIILPRALPILTCDKVKVTELYRNLITNAVKYNDSDEKLIEIGWCPPDVGSRAGASPILYVKDNGRGIAPEFHEEIFRIFRRLQQHSGTAEEGTGVGLTFVKKIIERHGGRIRIESAPGQGTNFLFTLGI